MRAIRRMLLLMCLLTTIVGVAACGTQDTSGPNGATRSYKVARCDGAPVAYAALSAQPPSAPPSIYVGTRASAGSGNLGLSALAPDDGTSRWCARFDFTQAYTCSPAAYSCPAPLTPNVGTPLVAGGVVYICVSGGPPGVLFALDAADGALRWSRQTGCQIVDMPFEDDAQPILADGILYSGTFGLAPADGSVRWHLPAQLANSTMGSVADGVAYAFSEQTISAVRMADSTVIWTYSPGSPISDRPVTFGNHLYVADMVGNPDTYAIDTRTGSVIWHAPTGSVSGSSAVEVNGLVYIGAEGTLYALDAATGAIRWRSQVASGASVQSTSVVSNGTVYFVGDGAYAVNATTGAVRWHNGLGWSVSKAFGGPALRDSILYLIGTTGDGQGTLYALDATSGIIRWQRSDINPEGTPVA